MKRTFFIILGVGILVLFILLFALYLTDRGAMEKINNFEECADHGYPIMESYPRQCRTPDGRLFVEEIVIDDSELEKIRITSPSPFEEITSPYIVRGEARGTWFFEASFPVKLLDSSGNVIYSSFATALNDWMTEDFVPFEATLEFEKPEDSTGILVLEKDNPSGLEEHADSVEVQVRFGD